MSSSSAPRNRRERRAHAHSHPQSNPSSTASTEVPLSQPSRTPPSHPTLLEIAQERQLLSREDKDTLLNSQSITTTTINPDGSLSSSSTSTSDPLDSPPFLDVLLYTTTLIITHFTLTFLVHHQYASEPPSIGPLFLASSLFSPTPLLFLVLVLILHPRASHLVTQVLFAAMSLLAGGWLVYATNDEPYMAVMKKAPALGTLWIWAIIEMRWEWAAACLSVIGGWGWWKGYTFF